MSQDGVRLHLGVLREAADYGSGWQVNVEDLAALTSPGASITGRNTISNKSSIWSWSGQSRRTHARHD